MGRALKRVLVHGTISWAHNGKHGVYEAPLDLCETCYLLYEEDPGFRIEIASRAGVEVAKNR